MSKSRSAQDLTIDSQSMVNLKSRKMNFNSRKVSQFSLNESDSNLVIAEGSSEIDFSESVYHQAHHHSQSTQIYLFLASAIINQSQENFAKAQNLIKNGDDIPEKDWKLLEEF